MEMNPDRKFEGIGNCLPGSADVGARSLIFAPNLRWRVRHLCLAKILSPRESAQSLAI
jgi:hypothetical protein